MERRGSSIECMCVCRGRGSAHASACINISLELRNTCNVGLEFYPLYQPSRRSLAVSAVQAAGNGARRQVRPRAHARTAQRSSLVCLCVLSVLSTGIDKDVFPAGARLPGSPPRAPPAPRGAHPPSLYLEKRTPPYLLASALSSLKISGASLVPIECAGEDNKQLPKKINNVIFQRGIYSC